MQLGNLICLQGEQRVTVKCGTDSSTKTYRQGFPEMTYNVFSGTLNPTHFTYRQMREINAFMTLFIHSHTLSRTQLGPDALSN